MVNRFSSSSKLLALSPTLHRTSVEAVSVKDAAPTTGKLAVLELRSYAKELTPQNVRYLSDRLRTTTLRRAPGFDVMTRENLLVLLQAGGKELVNCEGECEVDTGRRIGADVIVSGDVQRFGRSYKLSLRLHETGRGRLLSAAVGGGKGLDELDDAIEKVAAELLAALLP